MNTFKTQGKHLCLDLNAWINFNSWLNMHDSISGQIMLFEFFKYHCLYISYVTENIFAKSFNIIISMKVLCHIEILSLSLSLSLSLTWNGCVRGYILPLNRFSLKGFENVIVCMLLCFVGCDKLTSARHDDITTIYTIRLTFECWMVL